MLHYHGNQIWLEYNKDLSVIPPPSQTKLLGLHFGSTGSGQLLLKT